jgi:TatD DNase family protein
MGLIDSHAHLTFPELADQVDDVLTRAEEAGVERVITIGTDLADSRRAIELATRYPERVRAGAAFHPHETGKVADSDLTAMAALWDEPGVAACGEMGLDYHYDFADRVTQRSVFGRQLELARDKDKPIVIHCREAFEDLVPILIDCGYENRPVVFHCFTGSTAEAETIAGHGWRVSFTGVVTFAKTDELKEIARAYPADKLMVETDAPFLSPVPVRNKRPNEPAFLAHTVRYLAELRGVQYDQLDGQIAENTRSFFALR